MLRQHARVVVVGGGIIGNSIAYHLSKQGGWGKDVVLLEQNQVSSGTTWHAAGLIVTFGSLSSTSTALRKYSKDLYAKLEAETGQSTGLKQVGFIELATSADRLHEYRRIAAFNRRHGVDVQEISASEVLDKFPLCDVRDVEAGFYVPTDGRANPVDITAALGKGAKSGGVQIMEGVTAQGVTHSNGAVNGVNTSHGHISADYVVNAGGMWARQFAQEHGVVVPNQAAEHYYLITDTMPEVDPNWPVIEDPSSYTYIRPEAGGLMVGLFESEAASWSVDGVPGDFSFSEIDPDWGRIAPYLEKAMARVPACTKVGLKKLFCGPESFTPDLAPIVGEAPELKNYFVAAGMNSIGILTGGGIGKLVSDWIVDGLPSEDITGMNVDRFSGHMCTPKFRRERVVESLGKVYSAHYPSQSLKTCRGVKRTALYNHHVSKNAYFADVSGWEVPGWYGDHPKPTVETLTWGKESFFEAWQAEHRACREDVVAMDMSFMSRFIVTGRDAYALLSRLSTGNIEEVGRIRYCQWLNHKGLLEADITVARLSEDKFMVTATDTMHRHVERWMTKHIAPQKHVHVQDVTGATSQINLHGPNSRHILQQLVDDPDSVSNNNFDFGAVKQLPIGYCTPYISRITYVGELGYEIVVPVEQTLSLLEDLESFDLRWAGLKALGSLRLEKAYRDYGHDMDNCDTLLEMGLGFTCDYSKEFIGKQAILDQKAKGVRGLHHRLVQVLVKDPGAFMFHGEVLWRNNVCVGDIRSASYGHTLGGAVGLGAIQQDLAMTPITKDFIYTGDWEVEIAEKRYPVTVSLRPLYDPKNSAIKQ